MPAERIPDGSFPARVAVARERDIMAGDDDAFQAGPIPLRTPEQRAADLAAIRRESERLATENERLRVRDLRRRAARDPVIAAQLAEMGIPALRDSGARLVRMSDVEPEAVECIWHGRLVLGKLNLLDGDPGLGKSTLTADLAARVSRGLPMPDGLPGIAPAGVVICSAEDGLGDTIRPRLEVAGADLARIVALTIADEAGERSIAIPDDLTALEEAIVAVGARLVIIDPVMAHLPGTVNSYRDQDVRRALAPLAALADRTGCAIVAVRHLNKASGGNVLYRGGGSIGIIGAARVGLLVAPDPDDESGSRRVLAVTKCNLAPIAPALGFTVESATVESAAGTVETSGIVWGEATGHTAAQLLAMPSDDEERGAVGEAADVLASILAGGPVGAKEAQAEARQAGISEATLRRAKSALGVTARRTGGLGSAGRWEWSMPPKVLTETLRRSLPEDEHLRRNSEHLSDEAAPRLTAPADRTESATVECADYRAHQLHHRREGSGFVCDVCRGDRPGLAVQR